MDRNLHIEDGFVYFLHGWMQVVAEVFHIDISNGKFLEIMNESSILCGRIRMFDFTLPLQLILT